MARLITDKLLQYKDRDFDNTNPYFNEFFSEEENALREQHIEQYRRAVQVKERIRPQLNELEKKLNPLVDTETIETTPATQDIVKVGLHHYISQIKYGIYAQEDYGVELKPRDDDPKTIERVEKLDLVLRSEMLKARANKYIKEALMTSRKTFFGATLIGWKNPSDYGQDDNISFTPFEMTTLSPKNLLWDDNYNEIEKMDYVYVLSDMTWWDIVNHPVLGKNKELLTAIQEECSLEDKSQIFNISSETQAEQDFKTNAGDRNNNKLNESDVIVIKTRFWLKNKNQKDQECMVSYYIGEDLLLATHKAGCSMLPIALLYEYRQPGMFYGTNTIYNLNLLITNFELLLQRQYNKALKSGVPTILYSKELGIDKANFQTALLEEDIVWQEVDSDLVQQQALKIDATAVDPNVLTFIQDQERLIYQMAGIDKIVQGETGSLQTQSGVASVLQEARLLDESCLGYLQNYVERFNAIALEYIVRKYNGISKAAKIRVPKNEGFVDENGIDYDFISIPKGDFFDLKVDIIPSFEVTTSINRHQSLSTILQLITQDAQRPAGTKLFPDNAAVLEALKKFIPNYKWLKLALARANSEKWHQMGQIATQKAAAGLMQGLDGTKEINEVEDEIGDDISQLAQGGSIEELPDIEEPPAPGPSNPALQNLIEQGATQPQVAPPQTPLGQGEELPLENIENIQ